MANHLGAALKCFGGFLDESAACIRNGFMKGIHLAVKVKRELSMRAGIKLYFGIGFWNTFYFDGSWKFDGSRRLNARRSIMKMQTVLWMETDTQENIGNTETIIQRNVWFFDGSMKMDGSRKFNAVYRREEL